MNVVFVVLHYCQIDVTLNCINSLLRLRGGAKVVVVDNASPDGSGKLLNEQFHGSDYVYVILNKENLGFATANNKGYLYAKKKLNADVIAVLNNDTVIDDLDFVEKLLSLPLIHRYHIIAPDIVNKDGKHQNPFFLHPMPFKEICRNYNSLGLLKILYSLPLIGDIKANNSISYKEKETIEYDKEQEMIVPHGAAIVYTPLWVNNEDFAFYPGTFMYVEEIILYYYVMAHKYKTVYTPTLGVYHIEDISTNTRFNNKRKKALFQIKHMRESYRILIDFIKKNRLY